jgi:hypothetical protein
MHIAMLNLGNNINFVGKRPENGNYNSAVIAREEGDDLKLFPIFEE